MGLALVVQITIWMTSGVVMSFLPIGLVRGETASAYDAPVELAVKNYFPPGGVIAENGRAESVTLRNWLGRTVYIVKTADGRAMYDADTGDRLSPLSESDARRVAAADFIGEGEIVKAALLNDPPHEYRGTKPVWRIDFSDADETRIYVSPDTGEVASRRNRIWRFYDFFWMLHIMDYSERENFNNPLIRIFAATGLLFALSGVFLVSARLSGGRYGDDIKKMRKERDAAK
ncbi:MAG: PepSY domain-containing protein [Parvularculaceae bacterium]|nr:PepSY domain-containing protein [Parvularculaceae bacterium]